MKSYVKQYTHNLDFNIEFLTYDCFDLHCFCLTAKNILDSHIAATTLLPSSPPKGSTSTHSNPSSWTHFKAPKVSEPKWSGKIHEFYIWLYNVLHGFQLADYPDQIKLKLTLEAIPMDKQGLLNNVTEWDLFKERLIEEFGSIDVYGRDVNQDFALLPRFESVQECAEILTPKLKKLQSNLKIMQQFFDMEDLHSVTLTQALVQNIMRSLLPLEVKSSFKEKYADFRDLCPANVRPPTTLNFLAQFVCKMEKNYRANPSLYNLEQTINCVGVKPVKYGPPNTSNRPPNQPPRNSKVQLRHSCTLCSVKGFQDDHFPLTKYCGVEKFCSKDIISLIKELKVCPTCTCAHHTGFKCTQVFYNGDSKVCPTGCSVDGIHCIIKPVSTTTRPPLSICPR